MRSPIVFLWKIVFLWTIAAAAMAQPTVLVVPEVSGQLADKDIREASGLAHSTLSSNVLWIINDNGAKKIVHAVDYSGARLGEFRLGKSRNRDWEDLASFRFKGDAYLMVADIGDNDAVHGHGTLYFVEEPVPKKKDKEKLDWRVDFEYPDGARDAEAAAVDIDNERALILSKRDLPPRLYAVPLQTGSDEKVTASLLGSINSLQKPSGRDVQLAPVNKNWYWQPVGMDISADNLAAVILTYRAVYYYKRQPQQNWLEALNGKPARVSLGNFENAEAVTFGDNKRTVFVTGENKHSRLLRIEFPGETAP